MNPLRYLAPPSPYKELSTSNKKGLKERLSYAEALQHHPALQLSAEGAELLDTYQQACEALLEDPGNLNAAMRMLQYEQSLEPSAGSPVNLSFDLATKVKLGEELDNLYSVWTVSRYLKYLPTGIREEAGNHPSSKVEDPWHTAFWTPFHGRLEAEAEAFSQVLAGQNRHNECPTSLLLMLLCDRHTVDWDEARALIRHSAEGAQGAVVANLPESDFGELLRTKDVAGLATRLARDETGWSCSTEYVLGVSTLLMGFFANTLADTLFDTEEELMDPTKWAPKKPLRERLALTEGHEQAFRDLLQEMYLQMLVGSDDEDDDDFPVYDDYDDEFDDEDGEWEDEEGGEEDDGEESDEY
ncbi:uncharacterized protein BP01DRAFT_150855 [Aspergillus saccharolyticus JOP 1030-1]|uniref:Uncharacterized protein n=1 Tax=Aspergillus saccharolyticus JOP 1030-1 TaxID=1450539 RepID=A0A318ZLR2_9EURO|nr:hypothetical protein BP01DRAFT_150855 [Aspergillus saccharolyticus JOP 1030-1]PYH48529.1 hypothetical protein BP01DRAFT_150855 [Aspergillus saccharolyticus JOP 1030-1]